MIRVRFAPSPTGHLHVGGARTALFNWLFAKNQKGIFVLRIEDTDRTRSTLEANQAIIDGLRWLGLDWDEGPEIGGKYGPYFQTERVQIYKDYVQKLLNDGKAYFCYCTPEELEEQRKLAEERKEAPRYNGRCRKLSPEEKRDLIKAGRKAVIRFMLPPIGHTTVHDLIRGAVEFENDLLDDFVVLKSDGMPTYNFAAVVDDTLMKITHVIRGDDHLSNTPRQVLLYEAFGWEPPQFAHLPMILGPDRTRLSKRHGATSVVAYKEMGYLPEAMVNYLVRLGWAKGDQEIFTREELIEKFSLDEVGKSPAIFDLEKLDWMNAYYIRKLSLEEIIELAKPALEKAYGKIEGEKLKEIVRLEQERLKKIPDIIALTDYFFAEEIKYDEAAVEKYLKEPQAAKIFKELSQRLAKVETFIKDKIEEVFRGLASELGIKAKEIIHPARVALTGRAESPPMFEVVELIGKEKTLKRLENAVHFLTK